MNKRKIQARLIERDSNFRQFALCGGQPNLDLFDSEE